MFELNFNFRFFFLKKLDARAEHGIGDQEQRLAGALLERKCSIIVAANKWDLVKKKNF